MIKGEIAKRPSDTPLDRVWKKTGGYNKHYFPLCEVMQNADFEHCNIKAGK
jgi:hypothetical protein